MSKKLMYIHGFSSSGNSYASRTLARLLPGWDIISPDLPLNPFVALQLLHDLTETHSPDIVVGTSMGGMFAQQLRGYNKILVNPAFQVSEFMRQHQGENKFLYPRVDGLKTFDVTEALCDMYAQLEKHQFENITEQDIKQTNAMFGENDSLIDCSETYYRHYRHAIRFDGEHVLTRPDIENVLIPLVREMLENE